MLVKVKDCGRGVNRDLLASELGPNVFSDCTNARFRHGFAEKRKGIAAAFTTPTVVPYFMANYLTTSARFLVQAGTAKVFVDDGTTRSEITRYTAGITISSITRVGTTATLTTASAHGLSTGNIVTVYLAVPTGYNVTGAITVTGATTFTYVMAADPGASASTVGLYSYNVQADFTGDADDRWTGGAFNGVLILNHPVDGMYYWNGDVTTRLRLLPGGIKADAVLFYKNYILALSPTTSGTKQPQVIKWGSAAEAGSVPSTWTALSTNDAGDTPQTAETGGFLVDGLVYGDTAQIYDQDSRFALRYIGGNFVFQVTRQPDIDGVLAPGCIVNTPKGQVSLSNGDVKIHNGGESQSIIDGVNRRWLFANMDSTYATRSFLAVNQQANEVWVCFPTVGNSTCDRALVWNWNDNTWGDFSISGMTCATSALLPSALVSQIIDSQTAVINTAIQVIDENEYATNAGRLVLATNTPRIGLADTGSTDFGTAVPFMLEKKGISMDDSDSVKVLNGSRPQFKADAGTVVSVYHGSCMTADGTPTYSTAQTFTVGTDNFASRFANGGRYVAWKCTSTDYAQVFLRSIDLDINPAGRY